MTQDGRHNVLIFNDGTQIFHAQGKKDIWCVFRIGPNGKKFAPLDSEYFLELKILAEKYGVDRVYNDFVNLYEHTTENFDRNTIRLIQEIADTYREDWLGVEKLFATLYMAMISEFKYKNTVLGKRVKRLGVHQVLIDGYSPDKAASASVGKRARELMKLCKERGF